MVEAAVTVDGVRVIEVEASAKVRMRMPYSSHIIQFRRVPYTGNVEICTFSERGMLLKKSVVSAMPNTQAGRHS